MESRKLDGLSRSIVRRGNEDRARFQIISSQLLQAASQLGSEIKAGFSNILTQHTVTDSANQARHVTVLAHIDSLSKRDDLNSKKSDKVIQRQTRSIDMNEAGFQAVHSSLVAASSSSSEDHKTRHAMLCQCQGQLEQLIGNHATFGTVRNSVRLSTPRAGDSNAIFETTEFWKYSSYRMPIGLLTIHLNKSRRSKSSGRSLQQVCTESAIAVQFLPPPWLSKFAVNYSMKLSYDLMSDHRRWGATLSATLNLLTVNYNPIFIHAVENLDVQGVRRSFAEGLARPTDYILKYRSEPKPWYQVRLQSISNSDILSWSCSV